MSETVLEGFLGSLEVECIDIDIEDDGEDDASSKKRSYTINFPDGTIYSGADRFEVYLSALNKIGLEKVEKFAEQINMRRKTSIFVTKNQVDSFINHPDRQHYQYVEMNGFYIVKGIGWRTIVRFLNRFSEQYNLGLICTVE